MLSRPFVVRGDVDAVERASRRRRSRRSVSLIPYVVTTAMPAAAARSSSEASAADPPEQHGIEAPQGRGAVRIGREPASAGSAPRTGSAGRPRSARARRSPSSRASTSSDRTVGHQRADQHHQAGHVVRRQGQHPGAGPAEPPVGGLRRGDQRRAGQHHASRPTGRARGGDDRRRVGFARHRPRGGAWPGSAPARRDRPAAGRSRRSRPDCGAASPAPSAVPSARRSRSVTAATVRGRLTPFLRRQARSSTGSRSRRTRPGSAPGRATANSGRIGG